VRSMRCTGRHNDCHLGTHGTPLRGAERVPTWQSSARAHAAEAGQIVSAVKVTFAHSFGVAMIGGAVMLVVCSTLVWSFQRPAARGVPPP